MDTYPVIKVTSPSFSKNEALILELAELPFRVTLNSMGERFEGESLARYLSDADAAIVGLEKVNEELLRRCPRLRLIAKYGVGLDNIDLEACRRLGVKVGWTPGVNRHSVAEQTLGCLIGLHRNLFFSSRKMCQGLWEKIGGRQLSDITVGIIGLGNVGKELVRLLEPMGTTILANDIVDIRSYCDQFGVIPTSKAELFGRAHAVTLHVPLTSETKNMIDARSLAQMRTDSFLINTSRGEVVDQKALKHALKAGRIAGAALDVYTSEPPADMEFLKLPNLVCTPHIAGNSREAVLAMGRSAIRHLKGFYAVATPAEFSDSERRAA
ncbi:MAG: phosphoglycerate dehydrogenase [Verrucomicrobia bacterium]|nr:phosphoglycerate dehydrogenase [Verrucomicrobiota bacterium]MBI3869072.1 phosphoglycerate dehydrogenase [Verrucomicrobiota bacterium]